MFDQFKKMKELMELKKQADMMKREMEKIKVKVYEGDYEVVITGDQKFEEVNYKGDRRVDLEKLFNKSIKESQKVVAKKMKGQFSGMGLPGL